MEGSWGKIFNFSRALRLASPRLASPRSAPPLRGRRQLGPVGVVWVMESRVVV